MLNGLILNLWISIRNWTIKLWLFIKLKIHPFSKGRTVLHLSQETSDSIIMQKYNPEQAY